MGGRRMTECVFCALPETDILVENELALAFFDKFPVNEGHVLIIPKRHLASLFDATQEEIMSIWKLLEEVKEVLNNRFHPDGYNVGVQCRSSGRADSFPLTHSCHPTLSRRCNGSARWHTEN